MNIQEECAAIGGTIQRTQGTKVGFPITPILEFLVPMVLQCAGLTSGDALKAKAKEHYHEATDSFDHRSIRRLRPRARLAAHKAWAAGKIPQIPDTDGLDIISEGMLRHSLEIDAEVLTACAAESSGIEIDTTGLEADAE